MQAIPLPQSMTLVTRARTFVGVAALALALAVAGCADETAPGQARLGTSEAAPPRVGVPPPAPLPPPPKPPVRARPAAKPAAPGKPSNGSEPAPESASAVQAAPNDATDPPAVKEEPEAPANMTTAALTPPTIRLIGLDRNAVTAMLGVPVAERQVAAARVWDYRASDDCRLAVFFYLDTGRNDFYALHYEIDGAAPGSLSTDQCLQRIRDNARPQ